MRTGWIAISVACLVSAAAHAQVSVERLTELTTELAAMTEADAATATAIVDLHAQLSQMLNGAHGYETEILAAAENAIRSSGDSTRLFDEVEAMRTAVLAYQGQFQSARILNLIASFESALETDVTSQYSLEILQQLLGLADRIYAVPDMPASSSVARLAGLLEAEINQIFPEGAADAPDMSALLPRLDGARDALLRLETPFGNLALSRRIGDLMALLEEDPLAFDLRSRDLSDLTGLAMRIDAILEGEVETGIHIVRARFGRIGTASGQCDITATARQRCQAQETCHLPEAGFSLSGAGAFCGPDFAPLSLSGNRGAEVLYACLSATPAGWANVLASEAVPAGVDVQTAILRSMSDEIHCALDPT